MANKNYDNDFLIRQIENAGETFTSYDKIAATAHIRNETLWRIRKKKVVPNMQTAKSIADAIEVLRNESEKIKKAQKSAE